MVTSVLRNVTLLSKVQTLEPPYTERYVRWCGRSVGKIITHLLPDPPTTGTDSLVGLFTPLRVPDHLTHGIINDALCYHDAWHHQGVVREPPLQHKRKPT